MIIKGFLEEIGGIAGFFLGIVIGLLVALAISIIIVESARAEDSDAELRALVEKTERQTVVSDYDALRMIQMAKKSNDLDLIRRAALAAEGAETEDVTFCAVFYVYENRPGSVPVSLRKAYESGKKWDSYSEREVR